MAASTRQLELTLLPDRFAVSRLAADAPIPGWATQGAFFSVTRTCDELSVVCELSRVPVGVQSQSGWRVFKVHGPFVLSEIGVLSALAAPLAQADYDGWEYARVVSVEPIAIWVRSCVCRGFAASSSIRGKTGGPSSSARPICSAPSIES